jgi:23S rRNA-/tRNA-specific pseudouridylate synthase
MQCHVARQQQSPELAPAHPPLPRGVLLPGAVQLQVLHDDDHIAVVVKPFGVKCYGRGTRSVKHVLPGHLAPSSQGGALLA